MFTSILAYKAHLQQYHALNDSNLQSGGLIHAGESTSGSVERPCPFCKTVSPTAMSMQNHVALHLERIALFALPRSSVLEEDSDDERSWSGNANGEVEGSRTDEHETASELSNDSVAGLGTEGSPHRPLTADALISSDVEARVFDDTDRVDAFIASLGEDVAPAEEQDRGKEHRTHADTTDPLDAIDTAPGVSTPKTYLEKAWGRLFDDTGQPTPRLYQFFRGLADFLIEECEPKHSLVVGPEKMQMLYTEFGLPSEITSWHIVFDDATSSISRLYRALEAEHHLAQVKLDERPDTPALTPTGFAKWMSTVLRAYPEMEFTRLNDIASVTPVNNPDDRRERFPKEIPRTLFPKQADMEIRKRLMAAIQTHCFSEYAISGRAAPNWDEAVLKGLNEHRWRTV
jgi:hypothetical protein